MVTEEDTVKPQSVKREEYELIFEAIQIFESVEHKTLVEGDAGIRFVAAHRIQKSSISRRLGCFFFSVNALQLILKAK